MSIIVKVFATFFIGLFCAGAVSICQPSSSSAYREILFPKVCAQSEESSLFIDHLLSLPPSRAMLLLTEPLVSDGGTQELLNLRNAMVNLVSQYENEFGIILSKLRGFKHLSREDLMITALLHLIESLPDSCRLRPSIIETVNYVILKKYLYGGRFTDSKIGLIPDIETLSPVLGSHIQKLGHPFPNAMTNYGSYESLIWAAIELIHKPNTPQEQTLYQIIRKLFSENISILPSLIDVSQHRTPHELLNSLVTIIVERSNSPVIRQIFSAYGLYPIVDQGFISPNPTFKTGQGTPVDLIILALNLIPKPETSQDTLIYQTIISGIQSIIPSITQHLDLTRYTSPEMLLRGIFTTILENYPNHQLVDAIRKYKNYLSKYVPITFWQLPEIEIPGKHIPIHLIRLALELIPRPVTSPQIATYKTIISGIQKILPSIILHLDFARYTSPEDLLQGILTIILEKYPNHQLVDAMREYMMHFSKNMPGWWQVLPINIPGTHINTDLIKSALNLIPRPGTSREILIYETIISEIQKILPNIISYLDFPKYTSPSDLLQEIMTIILEKYPNHPLVDAIREYIMYFNKNIPGWKQISPITVPGTHVHIDLIKAALGLIPRPVTSQQIPIYDTIIRGLQGILPSIIPYLDLHRFTSPEDVLQEILTIILEKYPGHQLTGAIREYFTYFKKGIPGLGLWPVAPNKLPGTHIHIHLIKSALELIPRPVTSLQIPIYETIIRGIREILPIIILHLDFPRFTSPQDLLQEILTVILEKYPNHQLVGAIREYFTYFKKGIPGLDLWPSPSNKIPGIHIHIHLIKSALELIPRPVTSQHIPLYETIIRGLEEILPSIISLLDFSTLTSPDALLQEILTIILEKYPNHQLVDAIRRYYMLFNKNIPGGGMVLPKTPEIYIHIHLIKSALELIPRPITSQQIPVYETIIRGIQGILPSIILHLDFPRFTTPEELLQEILTVILEKYPNHQLVGAIREYFMYFNKPIPGWQPTSPTMIPGMHVHIHLIRAALDLIPKPVTSQQIPIYETIIRGLQELLPNIISHLDLQRFTSPEDVLQGILRIVLDKYPNHQLVIAIRRYFSKTVPGLEWVPSIEVPGMHIHPDLLKAVLELIPRPVTNSEMPIYQTIITGIQNYLPILSQHIDFTRFSSPVELLREIVRIFMEIYPTHPVVGAIKEYIITFNKVIPGIDIQITFPPVNIREKFTVMPLLPGRSVDINLIISALELIPRPTTNNEVTIYLNIINGMKEILPALIDHIDFTKYTSPSDLLQRIIGILVEKYPSHNITHFIRQYFVSLNKVPSGINIQEIIEIPIQGGFLKRPGPLITGRTPGRFILPSPGVDVHSREKYTINLIISALQLIPRPKTDQEVVPYQKIMNFFQQILPYLVQHVDFSRYKTPQEILHVIIQIVAENEIGRPIRDIIFMYNLYPNENYKRIFEFISLLPHPVTPEEQIRYQLLITFLKSPDFIRPIPHGYFMNVKSPQELFLSIVSYLMNPNTDNRIREAVIYFALKNHPLGVNFLDIFSSIPGINIMENHPLLSYLLSPEIFKLGLDLRAVPGTPQQKVKYLLLQLMKVPNREVIVSVQTLLKKFLTLEYHVDFSTLIPLLPQGDPTTLNILVEYLLGYDIYDIIQPNELNHTDKHHLLELVLQLISQRSRNPSLKEIAALYYSRITVVRRLLPLLPPPLTPEDQMRFNLVKQFLLGPHMMSILRGIDLGQYTDDEKLLDCILKTIVDHPSSGDIRNAFLYYLNQRDKLANVDLITKKEIRKHFKLTDIFKDALPVESSSGEVRSAFRIFFDYITEGSQAVMPGFVTWDQARSRGEFMQLLFVYLLENPLVPRDVKLAITVLQPCVNMSGRGALPP